MLSASWSERSARASAVMTIDECGADTTGCRDVADTTVCMQSLRCPSDRKPYYRTYAGRNGAPSGQAGTYPQVGE
eukprot:1941446-Prymnesium_polylepis.1